MVISSKNVRTISFGSLALYFISIILVSAAVSTAFNSPVVAQSPIILNNSVKLKEFQSATTGYVRYVKKVTSGNGDTISKLTDSYVAKIKSIFGQSPSSTVGCKPNDCIGSPQSTGHVNTAGNLSQDTKIKIREFRMLTSQFQKDVVLAAGPSSPPHVIGQLVDIYAKSVKDLFNNRV